MTQSADDKRQREPAPLSRPRDRHDLLIMILLFLGFLLIALVNLGSFMVPVTSWKPLKGGEMFDIDLGREMDVARIYYYCGVNEQKYDDAKFFVLHRQGDRFRPLTVIEKKACGVWKYEEVNARTSRLKVVANPPGGALNEMVVVERGSRMPLRPVRVITATPGPEKLFDEQETFEYLPTFRSGFYFDEIYHARTAFEQLHRMEQYETTHPPLGKTIIAGGIGLFGMNSFGWRIAATLFGAAMLPVIYLFARKLFDDRFFAFGAAYLMMVDFMHFTLSRIALVDVFGTFFIILMFSFMYEFFIGDDAPANPAASLRPLVLSGACFGLGAACKWIGLYSGAGLALLVAGRLFRHYRAHRKEQSVGRFLRSQVLPVAFYCVLSFVALPAVIYLFSYIPFLMTMGHDYGFLDILANQRDMYAYHSRLKATHPFSSPWWSWPLNLQPIWLYTGPDMPDGQVSSIASFGNPAIWWAGIPAVLVAAAIAWFRRERGMAVVFAGLASQYLPWAIVPRLAFIYHFFSVTPFMVLSQVYVLKTAVEKWPRLRLGVYGYFALAGALFVVFYPVLSGMQVPAVYIGKLRWLKTWIF